MPIPVHVRAGSGDSHAAGRARQRLKLLAIGYVNTRHGVDATEALAHSGLARLCQGALEYVDAMAGTPQGRRVDPRQGDSSPLQVAAIAYANARHGIDADVGMAREGLAMLCQAAIEYVESLPWEDTAKRSTNNLHLQLGNGG